MKNLLYLFICLSFISFIFSSCEKELLGCTDPVANNFNNLANTDDGSCIYIVYGCTDPTASNYAPSATDDDGSCIINWSELAIGTWNLDPNCEDIDVFGQVIPLNDQLPPTVDVLSDGDQALFIDLNGTQITGFIDANGNITVDPVTVSIDLGFPVDVDVVGTGQIISENSGLMDLNFSGGVPLLFSFSSDCNMILSR